ncbi:MAG TPA: MarR family winged helix-turn-helix transcriptional regulator [Allosphingosinicella sp.]|jgi:DNA-binding transcriptional ArsR family regulator
MNGAATTSDEAYEAGPRLLLIDEGPQGRDAAAGAIAALGLRAHPPVPLSAAEMRLNKQVAAGGVVLRAGSSAAPVLAIWPMLREAAEHGRHNSIVAAPAALKPVLGVLPRTHGITLMFDPSPLDWLTACSTGFERAPHRFHDSKDPGTPRLQQLSEEVGRIATALAALSEEDIAASEAAKGKIRIDAGLVRAMIRARRLRDQFFRSELFADPAWDMLLDLFAARLEKRKVAVSSLCIAAAVPPTTALRWIKSLSDQGLLVRLADAEDGRRVFIELSDQTAAALENYLRAAQRISPLVV